MLAELKQGQLTNDEMNKLIPNDEWLFVSTGNKPKPRIAFYPKSKYELY